MKKAMLISTVFVLIQLSFPTPSTAVGSAVTEKTQLPPSFSFLRMHKTANSYNIQWKMTGMGGVQSFVIESTYEDPTDQYSQWQMKGMVSTDNGVNTFKEKNLLPGIINYRITAMSADNTPVAVSEVLTFTVN